MWALRLAFAEWLFRLPWMRRPKWLATVADKAALLTTLCGPTS